jgi:hypothetical protein
MIIDKNLTINVIAVLIALGACAASIRSCSLTREALETNKAQFVSEKRPYLVVNPEKFLDNQKYLKVDKIDDNRLSLHVQFKIKNVGPVAAIDVYTPLEDFHVFDKSGQVPVSSTTQAPRITLGPGEETFRNIVVTFSGKEQKWADIALKDLTKKNKETSVVWFELRYHNELDRSIQYQQKSAYAFSFDDTRVLTSENNRIRTKK